MINYFIHNHLKAFSFSFLHILKNNNDAKAILKSVFVRTVISYLNPSSF